MTASVSPRTAPSAALLDEPLPGEGFLLAAAMGATVAGVIHLMVVPGHWGVSAPMSAFFIILGVGQLLLAAGLRWRPPDLGLVGVVLVGVAAISVALWAAQR